MDRFTTNGEHQGVPDPGIREISGSPTQARRRFKVTQLTALVLSTRAKWEQEEQSERDLASHGLMRMVTENEFIKGQRSAPHISHIYIALCINYVCQQVVHQIVVALTQQRSWQSLCIASRAQDRRAIHKKSLDSGSSRIIRHGSTVLSHDASLVAIDHVFSSQLC